MGHHYVIRPKPLRGKRLEADLVVFDLDGTLIDSAKDIAESLNITFERLGYDPLPEETIGQFVGNGVKPLIERAVIEAGHEDRLDDTLESFREVYQKRLLIHTKLFEGALTTLESLKVQGKSLGLATNKPARFAFPILEALDLTRFFVGGAIAGDTLKVSKPAPDALYKIAEKAKVDLSQTMIVGDSAVDVNTGKNAGAKTVGATYGFRSEEELLEAGVDALIDTPLELLSILGVEQTK